MKKKNINKVINKFYYFKKTQELAFVGFYIVHYSQEAIFLMDYKWGKMLGAPRKNGVCPIQKFLFCS